MKKFTLRVLAVDDEAAYLEVMAAVLAAAGHTVVTAADGVEAINKLQTSPFDLAILDINLPHVSGTEVLEFIQKQQLPTDAIIVTGVDDIRVAVQCIKMGAYEYITKPYSSDELEAVIRRVGEKRRLLHENSILKSALSRFELSATLVGRDTRFLEVLGLASKAAPSDSPILIEGPSGSGKELVAHFIHRNSSRSGNQFLTINCASMPGSLLESELFGHEKGAFTGAVGVKQGLVEIVDGGTLLLDEIGEISLELQPKLLRWLQTGEFRRVGGNHNMHSDVRVISATNKILRHEVEQKRFREDLFFRLNVFTLVLPGLKDRKEDIPLLADHFIRKKSPAGRSVSIDTQALDLMQAYDWPGNVRELENVLERALILCSGDRIRASDIAIPQVSSERSADTDSSRTPGKAESLATVEKRHIAEVLTMVQWNKKTTANILGISLKTLYTKIHLYQLKEE
jgi:DNA-binding NtrC family response regulator